MTEAAGRWREAAARIAIPSRIRDTVTASPWTFRTATFAHRADEALGERDDTPSDAIARALLPVGGSLLDVGSGAGAASLRLVDVAGAITAVDQSADLLAAFAERAVPRCEDVRALRATWPDAVARVATVDVVVCHHVLHNTAEPAAFVAALRRRARVGVVVELTAAHPRDWLRPLWRDLHGWDAPAGTSAALLDDVLVEAGVPVVRRREWDRPAGAHVGDDADHLAALSRQLSLPRERVDELAAALRRHPPPSSQRVVTLHLGP